MNQKIWGIIPLIVAIIFLAVFAAGNNEAAAASGSSSAGQTVAVTVRNNAQENISNNNNNNNNININGITSNNIQKDIALRVTPTAITMTTNGHNNPLGGSTAYSGTGPGNDNIMVRNAGNVPINVLIRSEGTQFSDGTNVFIPTAFTVNSQYGSSITILTTNTGIATNMPRNGPDSYFSTYLTLGIPFYVHAGTNYQNPLTYTAIESNS